MTGEWHEQAIKLFTDVKKITKIRMRTVFHELMNDFSLLITPWLIIKAP